MKKHSKSYYRNRVTLIPLLTLFLIILALIFFTKKDNNPNEPNQSNKPSAQTSTSTLGQDETEVPTTPDVDKPDGKVDSGSSDNNPTPSDNSVELYISSYNFNEDTKTIIVNTLVQTLDNSGKCAITLSKANTSLNSESTSFASSRVSTCHFEITSDTLIKGIWQAKINFEGSSLKGSIVQEINL